MVAMIESQCEYLMYFPASPISDLSDAAKYRTVPQRRHLYLGETVQFLLVLRFRDGETSTKARWRELVRSLSAVASVSQGEAQQPTQEFTQGHHGFQSNGSDDGEEEEGVDEEATPCGLEERTKVFRHCKPLLSHNAGPQNRTEELLTLEPSVLVEDEVVFSLTVSLDKLPVNTVKAKIVVTVWKEEQEKAEVREHGYLRVLHFRSPMHTFRQDRSAFKAQVSTTLSVLPPPSVKCQQMTVSGKHLTVLKVLNSSSLEELCIRDMKILPNLNSSYLPMMPDGSVLVMDNVCHRSSEVTMDAFRRVASESSRLPSMLSALEEQNFLFQMEPRDRSEEESDEGLEVPLIAVVHWSVSRRPLGRHISTHYTLPSVRLNRPQLLMTASCPSGTVRPYQGFQVKYTLLNNLRDFLSIRLVWTPDGSGGGGGGDGRPGAAPGQGQGPVVCRTPHTDLGPCRKGSVLRVSVGFQVLREGLFELSQNMKLKLQFSAVDWVGSPSKEALRGAPSRSDSPSSPRHARELLERTSLGRSQSFSHEQPPRSPFTRASSVMDRRAVTPPVPPHPARPSPLRAHPLAMPSLDKIAKRECKVLVLEPQANRC